MRSSIEWYQFEHLNRSESNRERTREGCMIQSDGGTRQGSTLSVFALRPQTQIHHCGVDIGRRDSQALGRSHGSGTADARGPLELGLLSDILAGQPMGCAMRGIFILSVPMSLRI